MAYGARLQSNTFDVHSPSASVLKASYQYSADGRIKAVDDQLNNLWDRSYGYDAVGRLNLASAGGGGGMPYYETFGHDGFNNLTNRWTEMWSDGGGGFAASYVNNRRQNDGSATWQHDAAGNVLGITHPNSPDFQQYAIDAAGQTTQNTEHSRHSFGPQTTVITRDLTIDQTYDGAGQRLKRVQSLTTQLNNNPPTTAQKVSYDLRSTVLGNHVVTELTATGQKDKGYVFAGGELLAVQQKDYQGNDQVLWSHTDPVTDTTLQTNSSGQVNSAVESQRLDLDPLAGAIPRTDPALDETSSIDAAMSRGWYMAAGDPFNPESGCAWDGMSTPCRNLEMIMRYLGVNGRGQDNFEIRGGRDLHFPGVRVRREWVEDDGEKKISPENLDIIVTDINDDGLGHYEFNAVWFVPQKPVLPVVSEQKYNECAKLLGNSPAPGYSQTAAIVGTSALEGTDPTLLAVTWSKEAIPPFNFSPVSNYRPEDGGWDVGPLQVSTTYYNKSPFTDGLPNPFGTVFSESQSFNGNAYSSLRVGARALNEIASRSRGRADTAGLYRAGSRKPASYRTRANEFNSLSKGYDAFFNCLKK
ncbi:MAG: hypothetical protein ACR2LM_03085 [Pyrinomonadaceae bacterium]